MPKFKKIHPVYPEQQRRKSYRSGFYHPISILILALITLTVALAIFANSGFFSNKNVPTPSPTLFATPKVSPSSSQYQNKQQNPGDLVSPDYVSLYLNTSMEQNKKIPSLILSAVAGGGCDSAGNLQTEQNYLDGKLVVQVIGYNLKKGKGEMCAAVITNSETKIAINMNWLEKPGDKVIAFYLNNQENLYQITYSNNKVTLKNIKATNVISRKLGYNPPEAPETLEVIF